MVRTLLLAVLSLVAAASVTTTMPTEALVVVAALAAARALMGVHAPVAVPATLRALRPRRRAADVPLVLAGRTTDVVHHPVRPRAPGLA